MTANEDGPEYTKVVLDAFEAASHPDVRAGISLLVKRLRAAGLLRSRTSIGPDSEEPARICGVLSPESRTPCTRPPGHLMREGHSGWDGETKVTWP